MAFQITRFGLLITLIVRESKNISDSNYTRSKVDYMFNVLSQFVYCWEYIPLLHGTRKFLSYIVSKENHKRLHDANIMIKSYLFDRCICMTCLVILCIIIVVFFHFALSLLPPFFLLFYKSAVYQLFYDSDNDMSRDIATAYVSLAFADHFYNFLVRLAMAYVTLAVIYIWKYSKNVIPNKLEEKQNSEIIVELENEYNETGELVDALQNIFQGWFIIKWIIYFIDISGHSVLASEVIFNTSFQDEEIKRFAFVLVHLAYDFLAFFYIFSCGSLMNHYHQDYRAFLSKKQKDHLSKSENEHFKMMQFSTLIPENPKYDFLPSVFLIDYPLNSPGYTLTMLLALFAFVANFFTQYE